MTNKKHKESYLAPESETMNLIAENTVCAVSVPSGSGYEGFTEEINNLFV